MTDIADYRFTPDDLRAAERQPGVSAFMRIRDGAFSLEAAIRSHIGHFDEIVAVYNRCTDATPEILGRLAAEFGPKLRVFHYLPPVFPPGSDGHKREPANSPLSLVNYYNFALSQTRFSHVTKLDDDHVAMGAATARLVADVRAGRAGHNEMACFSGLNLARDDEGQLGILAREPFSGSGDIGIFPLRREFYFVHDPRFEVLRRPGLKRRFHSVVYWHLKYLKPGFGFANYDLAANPQSRYAKRLVALERQHDVVGLSALARIADPRKRHLGRLYLLGLPVPARERIIAERNGAAIAAFGDRDLLDVLAADTAMAAFYK